MSKLITSSQFVTGLLCALKLRGVSKLRLIGSQTDAAFAQAYEDLVERMKELDVTPDFSLATDLFHGDSETLRETLYAARQKGIVSINNPSFKTVEIEVDDAEAEEFLRRLLRRRRKE
ncbi:hypothetical protein ACVINW_006601 [Bradyrhizobium sp. USDA 4461]